MHLTLGKGLEHDAALSWVARDLRKFSVVIHQREGHLVADRACALRCSQQEGIPEARKMTLRQSSDP
jgi:hypothetical protein